MGEMVQQKRLFTREAATAYDLLRLQATFSGIAGFAQQLLGIGEDALCRDAGIFLLNVADASLSN
jgi:hypothetical protein